MFRERIIVDDSLVATPTGGQLRVRLPWYRALPLSIVEKLDVTIDGEPVPAECVRLNVNGDSWTIDEVQDRWDDIWYVLDDGVVDLAGVEIESGRTYECDVTLGIRIPYLPVGGKALPQVERHAKTLIAKEQAA